MKWIEWLTSRGVTDVNAEMPEEINTKQDDTKQDDTKQDDTKQDDTKQENSTAQIEELTKQIKELTEVNRQLALNGGTPDKELTVEQAIYESFKIGE